MVLKFWAGQTYAVIERNGIDDHKMLEVVHVRCVVAVPCHHVEGTVVLSGLEQTSLVFVDDLILDIDVFEPGRWRLEISRIG